MKSLLITGGTGLLGGHLVERAMSGWDVYSTFFRSVPPAGTTFAKAARLDVKNGKEVQALFSEISPSVIIHTAAMTGMDMCALNKREAWETNVEGTEHLVTAAERVNARLVYLSTDLVFQGDAGNYSESDSASPACYYGETKLEGEKVISEISSNYCIARIALSYGWSVTSSLCFAEVMADKLSRGEEVRLFTDEFRSPVYIPNLCDALLEIAARNDVQGVIHLAGPERLSRFQFGIALCEAFGFDKDLIVPCLIEDFPFRDNRPKDCSLVSERAGVFPGSEFCAPRRGVRKMAAIR